MNERHEKIIVTFYHYDIKKARHYSFIIYMDTGVIYKGKTSFYGTSNLNKKFKSNVDIILQKKNIQYTNIEYNDIT